MRKLPISIIIIGAIIVTLGIIFHLQGRGIVGPPQSFMYSNPEWITYGQQIAIVGMLVIGAGIGLGIYLSKKR